MVAPNRLAEVAAVIGEPARAVMLSALMDHRALTALELARAAGITAQTASAHLHKLIDAKLVAVTPQGRHRYHRLAGPHVAQLLEALMLHATEAAPPRPVRTGPREAALREARTCYDHLAGRVSVALADALVAGGLLEFGWEAGTITPRGAKLFERHGILVGDAPTTARTGPLLCRPCLDWSERRPHLGGRLGAALCRHGFAHGWLRRRDATRAVLVTPKGRAAFADVFNLRL